MQAAFGPFLYRLGKESGGLLYRHGWLTQLLVGMLMPQAAERLTVHEAWKIARQATRRELTLTLSLSLTLTLTLSLA